MIEPIMFFGIGFLVASLLGLVFIPLVHGRAVRLTMRRLEASTPLSMAEIQADKDQLRAEFAMSTRRLEMTVEQLKTRTTAQFAELGKKTDAINLLKAELDQKNAAVVALEAREKAMTDQLQALEGEYTVKHSGMREAERALADKEAAFSKLACDYTDRSLATDGQRVEIVSLRTQIDMLKARVEDYEHQVKDAQERLDRKRGEAETAARMLAAERNKAENHGNRVADLERQFLAQTADAEMIGRHVQDLETRLGEQTRLLAEREHETAELRAALDAARRIETDLRAEIAEFDRRLASENESLRADKAHAEAQLAQAHEERIQAQRNLASLQKEAEETWAAERVESALLRERINDIAADVARMTMALEGPNSPIETMLAADPAPGARQNGGVRTTNGESNGRAAETGGTLADRIRALQARASRIPSPS